MTTPTSAAATAAATAASSVVRFASSPLRTPLPVDSSAADSAVTSSSRRGVLRLDLAPPLPPQGRSLFLLEPGTSGAGSAPSTAERGGGGPTIMSFRSHATTASSSDNCSSDGEEEGDGKPHHYLQPYAPIIALLLDPEGGVSSGLAAFNTDNQRAGLVAGHWPGIVPLTRPALAGLEAAEGDDGGDAAAAAGRRGGWSTTSRR